MDVKSVFLNCFINEELYVKQPPRFENKEKHQYIYKLVKALYGLKQVPRTRCERLSSFLGQNGFSREEVDTTLLKNR